MFFQCCVRATVTQLHATDFSVGPSSIVQKFTVQALGCANRKTVEQKNGRVPKKNDTHLFFEKGKSLSHVTTARKSHNKRTDDV